METKPGALLDVLKAFAAMLAVIVSVFLTAAAAVLAIGALVALAQWVL